jgi:hypothetical protein
LVAPHPEAGWSAQGLRVRLAQQAEQPVAVLPRWGLPQQALPEQALPEQGLPELPELAQAEEALAAVQEAALWAPEPPDLQVVVGAGLEWGVEGQLTRVEVARGAAVASGWKSQISALRRACLRARHRRLARGGGLHDRPYAGRGQRVLLP